MKPRKQGRPMGLVLAMPISYGSLIHFGHYMRAAYRYERWLDPSEDGDWPDTPPSWGRQPGRRIAQPIATWTEGSLPPVRGGPGNGSLEMRTRSGRARWVCQGVACQALGTCGGADGLWSAVL